MGHPWATGAHVPPALRQLVLSAVQKMEKGRQQLLSRQKQRLGVVDGLPRLVEGGGLSGPTWVLEFVASSPYCSEGPEPVAELGTQSHLDDVVPS